MIVEASDSQTLEKQQQRRPAAVKEILGCDDWDASVTDCIAAVISFTTPRDAYHLACISTTFRSATDSDVVWDCFLPPEYLSNSSTSSYSATWLALSKKELYFRTCHNLIHNGKMSFWLDPPSGKKCYMISPRELNIYARSWFSILNANADFMRHLAILDCRFFEELVTHVGGCPFEIGGKITTSLLSLTTTYVAYLVFPKNRVDNGPAEITVGLAGSNNGQSRTVYNHQEQQDGDDGGFYPKMRADGWLEIELGEFFNGGEKEGELLINIKSKLMECLIVEEINIRPKKE